MSGTAMMATTMVYDPLTQAQQLAERVGVAQAKSLDSQALAVALRRIDGKDLVAAGDVFKQWDNLPIINYGLVVEHADMPESFMNEYPMAAHLGGRINQVPWLLSSTSRTGEGSMFLLHTFANPQLRKEFNANFLELYGLLLYLPKGSSEDTVRQILTEYGVQDMELNEDTLATLSAILGDFIFVYPMLVSAASYAAVAQQPVSIYNFEYLSNISYAAIFTGGILYDQLGACHMDDALYSISMPMLKLDFPKSSEEDLVIKRLTARLVEFAKNGWVYPNPYSHI